MISIAARPFKTNGVFYEAGSVLTDLALIRNFKTKVTNKQIAYVNEQNVVAISEYLMSHQGVDVKEKLLQALSVNEQVEEVIPPVVKEAAPVVTKPVVAQPVVKTPEPTATPVMPVVKEPAKVGDTVDLELLGGSNK